MIDRLNEEYGYGLYIPEDKKVSVYMAYKDMTPEEFEIMIKELEEFSNNEHNESDSGGNNFEYFDIPSQAP